MVFLALSLMCLGVSAVLALAASPRPQRSGRIAVAGCAAASVFGLAAAWRAFTSASPEFFRIESGLPFGSFYIGMDRLSAFFVVVILAVCLPAALYGLTYMRSYGTQKRAGGSWFFFNVLAASMMLVVTARNGFLLLVAWELMTLSSFFLVTLEHEKPAVRRAGLTYLTAAHLGTAFLLVFFLLLGRSSGSMDFEHLSPGGTGSAAAGFLWACALAGFGTKAGLIPFHVWLPEAHPAAPSHVSALMSGVMIKMGIYGLLRAAAFLGGVPLWWGWTLTVLGLISGMAGILFAISRADMKSLLAYSTVENAGIIVTGLGLGYLGAGYGLPFLSAAGFAAAFLHVLNHALFKTLLFFTAGSVLHAAGTCATDRLGGLMKRMPWTGALFAVGAAAISGLPPLNGFFSEFVIYFGALRTAVSGHAGLAAPMMAVVGAMAGTGALAAACFSGLFGICFLGQGRSREASEARETGWGMRFPMLVLAAACAAAGSLAPLLLRGLGPLIAETGKIPCGEVFSAADVLSRPLKIAAAAGWAVVLFCAVLLAIRSAVLSRRPVTRSVTWDCGYAGPSPRMQYTLSSFFNLLRVMSRPLAGMRRDAELPRGIFPRTARLATESFDTFRERGYVPLFKKIGSLFHRLRWIQHGRLNLYILYIAATLLTLLVWNMR